VGGGLHFLSFPGKMLHGEAMEVCNGKSVVEDALASWTTPSDRKPPRAVARFLPAWRSTTRRPFASREQRAHVNQGEKPNA
jgi:hypothetical protein